jgi:5'-phosphate synthase pdxT subunit
MRIGVLALQGGFAAHARALEAAGHDAVLIRDAGALDGLEGLVLPGGESSAQLRLLQAADMLAGLDALWRRGVPVLATCAGLILIARQVTDPSQPSLGWLDVEAQRNGYGRQLDSFVGRDDADARDLVFIRAPRIRHLANHVEVLARHRGEPVMVRQGSVVGCTYHPELADPVDLAWMGPRISAIQPPGSALSRPA